MKNNKKLVVAIDSFKGSLSTFQSGEAVKEAFLEIYPDAEVDICPLADGGEGTVDAIVFATGSRYVSVKVHDPLDRIIEARYGIIDKSKTAVIEMSAAAGITLVKDDERNPLNTTTYGVGELIRDALGKGVRRFILGIGGSATNDGGVGMLEALGFEFLDKSGNKISHGAKGLSELYEIKVENRLPELRECSFLVASDVKNPLCGELGASAVYGPQKGATPDMVRDMDSWLSSYASLTEKIYPDADRSYPGTGAAGGLGFALLSYLGASLISGIELVISETGLEEHIKNADIVVTGEGRLDSQSCMGKAPIGVARAAKKYGKTVIAFAGAVTEDARLCNECGIDAFFPILRGVVTLPEAMKSENAYKNLKATATQVFSLMRAVENK